MSAAVVMRAYGAPEVLAWESVPTLPLGPREVRIATVAAAVNHTDLEIRAGRWPVRRPAPFPYVPGVEVVGTVEAVGAAVGEWAPGQAVITMMLGLGGVRAERDGGHAERVTVDADAIAAVPAGVDLVDMAAVGLGGVTAFAGLRRLGGLDGRRVLVTGAAGGVGSAAVAIARALGATVTALVARPEHADYVRALGADAVVVAPRGSVPALAPKSVDGVLESVGGAAFPACVAALRPGGTLSLVGAVGGGDVALDAWRLIEPLTLTGWSSESLDGATLRAAIARLAGWLQTGAIRAPERRTFALRDAAAAHRFLEQGGVRGRVLLVAEAGGVAARRD